MQKATRTVNPGDIRRKLGLNQSEFWGKIGVTQSGGSRYESGRNMPRPVRELLRLVHVEGIDLTRAKGEDFAIAEQLKRSNAKLYDKMRAAVRSGQTNGSRKSTSRAK
jgi:transcriptional regulator with XRE-family HTH domain